MFYTVSGAVVGSFDLIALGRRRVAGHYQLVNTTLNTDQLQPVITESPTDRSARHTTHCHCSASIITLFRSQIYGAENNLFLFVQFTNKVWYGDYTPYVTRSQHCDSQGCECMTSIFQLFTRQKLRKHVARAAARQGSRYGKYKFARKIRNPKDSFRQMLMHNFTSLHVTSSCVLYFSRYSET